MVGGVPGKQSIPTKRLGDLFREDEVAQRIPCPIIGNATQITPSHKGPARGLGESFEVCHLARIHLL